MYLCSILKGKPKHLQRSFYSVKKLIKDEDNLGRRLYQQIKVKGPITVADYMKEVLTNSTMGYYMHKDVFGVSGDFITSPEITQMFGEIVAVWLINEWQKMGSPKPLQIVELGPGITHEGIPVNWYKNLYDIPKCFTLLIAHEFFDALPIHKFIRTNKGYREVLIDIDPSFVGNGDINEPKFRYVLSRHETPMQKKLIRPNENREHVEISPDSMMVYVEICERIKESGGLALICDYGNLRCATDSFRAFKKHKQVDPLVQPGSADLTADVDFSAIKDAADEVKGILTFGPTTQREFLLQTGLEFRFKVLKDKINDEKNIINLNESYKTLIDEDKMGERFKFMALFPETMKIIFEHYPVIGFSAK
ncbi:protein arginine methyltransferase NDUFAF7, mitochondrial isoform X2 [Diabrotica virgifera virgifera]|uniref:Protein arginine methyltransferase NDUFAF7 n=1 Tax=Diabrotica virgifera virgifera TaxID=50390 RepID=A0ABM5K690_DIAVI|nr:protein arginine methyltransferase NDUFAF7, mitochondrial isoform X2 [Diabrotica virgifera virgifera]